MKIRSLWFPALSLAVICFSGVAISQEKKESGGSLGDLFNKVKDLKVPESVSSLPGQLTDLKESYLETAKTVEELKVEVGKLREEVASLRAENGDLKKGITTQQKSENLSDIMKPIEVSSTALVSAYAESRIAADEQFKDRYLKVVGFIAAFESGSEGMKIFLKADGLDQKVRCLLKRDSNLYVEVLAAQGRLISGNDRRTLLTVGQPVAILGTCSGAQLNVDIKNCKIEGLEEKKAEKPETNRR